MLVNEMMHGGLQIINDDECQILNWPISGSAHLLRSFQNQLICPTIGAQYRILVLYAAVVPRLLLANMYSKS